MGFFNPTAQPKFLGSGCQLPGIIMKQLLQVSEYSLQIQGPLLFLRNWGHDED